MSGVVDKNGQQWERCNRCGRWVQFQLLHYEQPSEKYEFGRDLCPTCDKVLTTPNPSLRNRWLQLSQS